ncbi:MAG: glycosyltransferase [bacterium]|nr:glycosyltransferase [bacterium]
MRTTLVCTVLNEEQSIQIFLASVAGQTTIPNEVIIVDGGSIDRTVEIIKQFSKKVQLTIRIFTKVGNRSVGRNFGIKRSRNKIILLSDAGCILEKKWVEEITKPLQSRNIDVVAGYYKGRAKTAFERSLVPYALVMPDRVNKKTFLPASRSMAIRKSTWKLRSGFPEQFSHNEDYVFAKNLERYSANIAFCKQAVVYWIPPKSPLGAFMMFFRFALGDMQSGLIRLKVIFLFLRYIFFLGLLFLYITGGSLFLLLFLIMSGWVYILWAIKKNFKYVKIWQAIVLLPFLQILADFAVILGSLIGFFDLLKSWVFKKTESVI